MTTLDELLNDLRARHDAVARELDAARDAPAEEERARLKRAIFELHQETDAALQRLGALRAEVATLVERYKVLAAAAPADRPPGPAGALPRADHLGSSTFSERGWNAIAGGDYERAVRELERALELAPDEPRALGLLGWAKMLQERYDEALLALQRVLARDPENALARANLGYVCLKKGIFGEAIEHLSRVIRLDGDRKATLYAHFYLGLVYLEREMYADARTFLIRALELGPNLIQAYWELGRVLYLEGNPDAAASAWRRGHETNRFNPWGEKCAAALAQLEAGGPPPF